MNRPTDTTKARHTRVERARILKELEEGKRDIRSLLDLPPDAVQGADVWDVLLRVPNLGRQGIKTCCERSRVWPHHRLGDLLDDEIERLKAALPERVN